nr:hypothetical protein [Tanacetum cinerariifolium]
ESTFMEDNPVAPVDNNPFINVFAPEPSSDTSSFGDVSSIELTYVSQTLHHLTVQALVNSVSTPSSTTIDQDAPSPNNLIAPVDNNPFINVFAPEPSSDTSSFGDVSSIESTLRLSNTSSSYEDLGKLQPTTDIGIFIGYAPSRRGPAPIFLMTGQISSRLIPYPVPAAPYVPPTNKDLEILFQSMFDEYLEPPRIERLVSPAPAVQALVNSVSTPSSTTIDQDAPSLSISPSSLA